MKKITSLLLIVASLFGLAGCMVKRENAYPYKGPHKELYTAAIYSIPDAVGYMHHGEGAYNADIHIWEQDEYGRTLFSYCEDYGNQVFALVIAQAAEESKVYFYPDVNYALTLIDSEYSYEGADDNALKDRTKAFYTEAKDQLKEANDWNQPLDKSKCVSYSVTDHKSLGKNIYSLDSKKCNAILNEYTQTLNIANPESGPHRTNKVLQVDANGKILHEISGVHRNFDQVDSKNKQEFTYYDITLWVITDSEGNYDKENGVLVMYSKANGDGTFIYTASDVLEFKNKNGWSYSYEPADNPASEE